MQQQTALACKMLLTLDVFFHLLFINIHRDKCPNLQCELQELGGRMSGFLFQHPGSFFFGFQSKSRIACMGCRVTCCLPFCQGAAVMLVRYPESIAADGPTML